MRTATHQKRESGGTILVYFIVMCVFASAIAGLGAYVTQTTSLAKRRSDMVAAEQYAESGAVIGCSDLRKAYTNSTAGVFPDNLMASGSYVLDTSVTNSSQKVYTRTITAPFTNQTVTAQVWVPNVPSPLAAKVVSTATVGDVTQKATVNVSLTFAFPAAIISVNDGTSDSSVAKSSAQAGNVVVNGAGS